MPNETHAIRGLRSVASRQCGCLTVEQLRDAGVSRGQVERIACKDQRLKARGIDVRRFTA